MSSTNGNRSRKNIGNERILLALLDDALASMRNFLTGILQSVGLLTAIAGCIFKGTPMGGVKAMCFGISGLSLYLIVTLISGRTFIYNKFAGGRELSREESPGEFKFFIIILVLIIGFLIVRCVSQSTAV